MRRSTLQEITHIIERDSKDTTYKFALLRGVIDIVQSRSPYIKELGDQVQMPIGLLIEKWLLYYYPIIADHRFIPQKNGEKNKKGVRLAFRTEMRKLTEYYRSKGGFSVFYNDFNHRGIPVEIEKDFWKLCQKLNDTITSMPMRYLGKSVFQKDYGVFQPYKRSRRHNIPSGQIDLKLLISAFGTFTIPATYYEVFRFMGSFLSGMDNLLFQWAEFTVKASGKQLSTEEVLRFLLTSPVNEREVLEARILYNRMSKQKGQLSCVWTGHSVRKYDVDHVIPFSVWRNNDLWNLLPASPKANNQKRDRIPDPELLNRQKDRIIYYWEMLNLESPIRFQKEVHLSLIGDRLSDNWQLPAFNRLVDNCNYLIDIRGFEAWKP